MPHAVPLLPWEKVGADLFQFDGKSYLLLVDYYSKFFEVSMLPTTRACDVVLYMKSHFARHGIPRELVSDNAQQFAGNEFAKFAVAWGFCHTLVSPKLPQSNGEAERSIQTLKDMLKKAKACGQDPYMALLQYRNTPLPGSASPAQLLMNRRLRTTLPATSMRLKPRVPHEAKVAQAIAKRQQQQAQGYNKTARKRPLRPLKAGEAVYMQIEKGSTREPATIVSEASTPRSYIVRKEDGSTYRRNRIMLRPSKV
jgi:hypothetical protein